MFQLSSQEQDQIQRICAGKFNIFEQNIKDIFPSCWSSNRFSIARYRDQLDLVASTPLGPRLDGVFSDKEYICNTLDQRICHTVIEARRRNQLGEIIWHDGIVLTVRPRASAGEMQAEIVTLILQWEFESNEQRRRYQNSSAGRRAARAMERRKRREKAKTAVLMRALPDFNLGYLQATIQWLSSMVVLDFPLSTEDTNMIVEYFARAGYKPFEFLSDEIKVPWRNSPDRVYFGQMLIKHLLTEVYFTGAFRGLVEVDVKRWNECFAKH